MGRELSNSPSAVKARQYRERKAAKQQIIEPTLVTDAPINIVDNSQPQIEVTENTAPKLSLKDRLFGTNGTVSQKAKAVKKGQRGKQIDASLMSKVLPTMISGSVTLYAQKLIKDPYKPCAPTQQEVFGTIGPLFSILARRVEIVGTASEDMIDLIHALLTGLCTGIRMHITYLSIQEQIERAKQNDGHVHVPTGRGATNHGTIPTAISSSRTNLVSTGFSTDSRTDDANGATDLADGDSGDAKREAAMFANLFKRDMQGRKQLGLLA